MRGRLAVPLLLLVLGPAMLAAQDCEAVRFGRFNVTNQGLPTQVAYFEEAEIACPGGKRLIADRAIQVQMAGRIELIGNVRYRDAERSLIAQRAEYYKVQQHIHATGNVVVQDLKTGSTVYGQEVNYYQAGGVRAESELEVMPSTSGPRPRAVLREERAPEASIGDSTEVVADMIRVLGERRFRGLGNAIITRDSLTAYGGIADYDQATGYMQLTVQGRIEGREYQLLGDTVTALLAGDTLKEVTAVRNGKLTAREVVVDAPRIRIELDQGELQRLIAAGARDSTAPPPGQPRILAREFRLSADSIDVLAPRQELQEVIAIGSAYSSTNDSIPAPPDVGELASALGTDWMRGDTVHAYFTDNPRAATDTAADARVLDRVVSSGAPASSLYRRREATTPAQPAADSAPAPATTTEYSIGYLLARRIEVIMAEGEVRDVNASEDVRGVYLQPRSSRTTQAARDDQRKP